MKKLVAALLASAALFGFGMEAFAADSDQPPIAPREVTGTVRPGVEPPEVPHYACPSTPRINCMPPVGKAAQRWCDPEYLKWAKVNCPGLEVVY